MSSLKLYLNEHLSPRLAEQLRQHGFDVISTIEAKMDAASDETQLEYAASEQRTVVTFNHKDFVPLHENIWQMGKNIGELSFPPKSP